MTHYTVDYSQMTPSEKYAKALDDIWSYVGAERFARIHHDFMTYRDKDGWFLSEDAFHLVLSFAGIEGYPAHVWYCELFPYG